MSKTTEALDECMTVAQLIEALKQFNPSSPVVFSYPYGDRAGSKVADGIIDVEIERVEWSEYHRSLKVGEGTDKVVVIS